MHRTTTQKGYGTAHKRERDRMARIVNAGGGYCVRCGNWIDPSFKWMAGHDHHNGGYAGAEHYKCGVGERNERHARRRKIRSRVW